MKTIRLITTSILLLLFFSMQAQVKKGVLDNGLTYYLFQSKEIQGKAGLFLLQKTGSLVEEENERGLAHFLEHMCFNGSDNFPNRSMIELFDSKGLTGSLNAHTEMEKTIYKITNIPLADKELWDKSFLVIHDWMNSLKFDQKAFDSEKKVVLEEIKSSQNLYDRLDKSMNGPLFNNTRYSKRRAGGLVSVVEKMDRDLMINFYKKWFTNKNQAIIVLGDIDIAETEKKIKDVFSSIPKDENYTPVPSFTVPENKETLYKHFQDKEIQSNAIRISYRSKRKEYKSVEDRKFDYYLDMVINTILKQKTTILSERDYINTKSCGINYSKLTNDYYSYNINVTYNKDKAKEALSNLLSIHKQILENGFSMDDFENAVKVVNKKLIIQKKIGPSISGMKEQFIDNFITKNVITGPNNEFRIFEKIFSRFTLDNINKRFKEIASEHNKSIIVMTGSDDHLSKEQVEEIEKNAPAKKISDFTAEKIVEIPFVNKELKGSFIKGEMPIKDLGVQHWELENGAKIYFKRTVDAQIQLTARSLGGYSVYKGEEQKAAKQFNAYSSMFGLANCDAGTVSKYFYLKKMGMDFGVYDYYETVSFFSPKNDIAKSFEALYAFFENPYFDKDEYNKSIKENGPSFEQMVEVYKDRFADASDFNFFILGNMSKKEAKKLSEKYIGSIPSTNREENYDNIKLDFPEKEIVILPQKVKGRVTNTVKLTVEKDNNYKDAIALNIARDYLDLIFTNLLRVKLQGTYTVNTAMNFSNKAKKFITCSITYNCEEKNLYYMNKSLREQIKNVSTIGMNINTFDNLKKKYSRLTSSIANTNRFYSAALIKYIEDNFNANDPESISSVAQDIDFNYVNDLMKYVLSNAHIEDIRQ